MERQLAAQQLIILHGHRNLGGIDAATQTDDGSNNDVLMFIDRTTIEDDHHEFESMTDEQWAEFRDSWHSNRHRGYLMDTLHNLEETILEGIVDRIESEAEDESMGPWAETILEGIVDRNENNNNPDNNDDDLEEDPI